MAVLAIGSLLLVKVLLVLLSSATLLALPYPRDQLTETQLLPDGFSCTQQMPRQMDIYSTPPNSNLIKVDLIHVFCGQIYSSGSSSNSNSMRVGGFHARPGNQDPESATTAYSVLLRTPPNEYGYAVYKYPYVYDYRKEMYVAKNTGTISSMWPTVLSMEEIAEVITRLVYLCKPSRKLHLCVSDFSLLPGNSKAELFDVVVIVRSYGQVARSAYPTARGTCNNKSSSYFHKCCFNYTLSHSAPM